MTAGQWVLLASVLLVAAYGAWRARTEGAFRGGRRAGDADRPTPADVVDQTDEVDVVALLREQEVEVASGSRATLVQFSSAFCQPCRATRVVLADVAAMVPGVVHVEVDAESNLDMVRRLDVTRTPTVLVLDAAGQVRARATGTPRRADVIAAVGRIA